MVVILHDPNHPVTYTDRIHVTAARPHYAKGDPDIMTERLMRDVFEVTARALREPQSKRPYIVLWPEPVAGRLIRPST